MKMCERIKALRKEAGLTVEDFAARVKISPALVFKLEAGERGKTYEKLPRFAKALGCRVDDLFPEMDGYIVGETPGVGKYIGGVDYAAEAYEIKALREECENRGREWEAMHGKLLGLARETRTMCRFCKHRENTKTTACREADWECMECSAVCRCFGCDRDYSHFDEDHNAVFEVDG